MRFAFLTLFLFGGCLWAEELVPAAMGLRTDGKGNSWSIEENGSIGRIGSTMINSGLSLEVNGTKFVPGQPLMTPDGEELVINAADPSANGLQVTRRVRVMKPNGGLRFLEILENRSANPIRTRVSLATNFSGNFKNFVTNRGRSDALILGKSESGILVVPGASQSAKAFVFGLCSESAARKPTISARNRYSMNFQYFIEIPPGETRTIAHTVGQVVIPQSYDRQTLLRAFRPFLIDRLPGLEGFDLANGAELGSSGLVDISLQGSLQQLGVDAGERDVLAIGEDTRLVGRVSSGGWTWKSNLGEGSSELSEIAALAGGNKGLRNQSTIYFRDGEILSGELAVEQLEFSRGSASKMEIDPGSLDRLVMKSDLKENQSVGNKGMVITHSGDRLAIPLNETLEIVCATAWGPVTFDIEDLMILHPLGEETSGYLLKLKDGSQLRVFLPENISFASRRLGSVSISPDMIHSIVTPSAANRDQGGFPSLQATAIQLAGNQTIYGSVKTETLSLLSTRQVIEITPGETRTWSRAEDGRFRVETWDSGVLEGQVREPLLVVAHRGADWHIPFSDIRGIQSAAPLPGVDKAKEITALLTQLGSDEWQVREKATRELGAYGYLAHPLLKREFQKTNDPEVRRRIDRVIRETSK